MEENTQSTGFIPEPPEEFTTTDAMVGVFTEPGETYESVSRNPGKNYWVIITLIYICLNLISAFILNLDPEIMKNETRVVLEMMQENFDKQVKDGTMSQQQADEIMEQQRSFNNPDSAFSSIKLYIQNFIVPIIILLMLGTLYFIGMKVLKSPISYANTLNVLGIAFMILGVKSIVEALLSVLTGSLSTLSPALFLSLESTDYSIFSFFRLIDVFSIWFYIVVSIGLSKIGLVPFTKTSILVFGTWILFVFLMTFGMGALFG